MELDSLFERCRRREGHAFEQLVKMHRKALSTILRLKGYTYEDVQDILQVTYISVWQNIDQAQSSETFLPWLKKIMNNNAIDHVRMKDRKGLTNILDDELLDSDLFSKYNGKHRHDEMAKIVKDALLKLTDDEQMVISLYYFSKNTFDEIAALTDSTVSAVKIQLRSAHDKLTASLHDVFL